MTLAPVAIVYVLTCALALSSAPAVAATGEGCPNEQVRAESDVSPATGAPFSLQLPECRAYEMVTPPLKNGAPVTSSTTPAAYSLSTVARVGSEGSTVLIKSTGIWPSAEQPPSSNLFNTNGEEAVQYKVTRGESGWGFKPEEPPAGDLREFESSLLPSSVGLGSDMSSNGIWQGAGLAPTETRQIARKDSPNFYLLQSSGAFAEIGPSVPLSDQESGTTSEGNGEVLAVGGSADLSHMLFSVGDFRWPFDRTKLNGSQAILSLYEYIGSSHSGKGSDVPTLVGVDNTGALVSECGIEAGGYEPGGSSSLERPDDTGEVEARSISVGGSTMFFTSSPPESVCKGGTGPAVNEVFARVGQPGSGIEVGSAVTVNVAGTSDCATAPFDSCNVTQPVKYQGASADGSKVFFTSEQPLVAGDTDPTDNLYECSLPGDSGARLTRMEPVNPCPNPLVRLSVPVSSAGAEVQSVAAISRDGSHVYFVAKGELAGPNAKGKSPTPGQDNLYVWAEGHTAFIATLSSSAFKLGEAQATPDGDSLVFLSAADLTPDDTSTVSQVFLYEASHEALTRVSEGQGGVEDGSTTTDPASFVSDAISTAQSRSAEGRRVISEDGSMVVFESSAALTPEVHGGTHNVYLWRRGKVHLISDGTLAGTAGNTGVAGLVGIDASGQNVFFTTEAPLVAQDSDELSDLYDARVDGGFPAPKVEECAGEACQGPLGAPPAPVTLGSLSPSAQGNLTLAPLVKPIVVVSPPKPKQLTRPEKLAKALKECKKDHTKKKLTKCEAAARKHYGPKAKRKRNAKRGSRKVAGE